MSFQELLAFGHIYEKKLLEHIEHDSFVIKEGLFSYYDIKVYHGDKVIRYEVKADRMAYRTGNIVIEYMSNSVPSGISITRAKYYAYFVVKPYDQYDLYIIPVKHIKKLINEQNYKRELRGGNNKLSCMFVFSLDTFEEFKTHST